MSAVLRRELWPNVENPATIEATSMSSTFAPEFDFSDLTTTPIIDHRAGNYRPAKCFRVITDAYSFQPAI